MVSSNHPIKGSNPSRDFSFRSYNNPHGDLRDMALSSNGTDLSESIGRGEGFPSFWRLVCRTKVMGHKYQSIGCTEPPPVYGHFGGGEPIVKPT
jgi:hypothetical protein